jgi:hypothetical protein
MYPCDSNITDIPDEFQIKKGSIGSLFSFKKKNFKGQEPYKSSTPDLSSPSKNGSLALKKKLRKSIGDLFIPSKTEFEDIISEKAMNSEEEKLLGIGSLLNTISVSKS